jgi:hypothetical protein
MTSPSPSPKLTTRSVEGALLEPWVIDIVMESAYSRDEEDVTEFRAQRDKVKREIETLTADVAAGGGLTTLIQALTDREKRLRYLEAKLVPVVDPDRQKLRHALEQRVDD